MINYSNFLCRRDLVEDFFGTIYYHSLEQKALERDFSELSHAAIVIV